MIPPQTSTQKLDFSQITVFADDCICYHEIREIDQDSVKLQKNINCKSGVILELSDREKFCNNFTISGKVLV